MIDPIVAFDKLAGFQSAREIADYFRSEGIRGFRMDAFSCPIAAFMQDQTGRRFSVCRDDVSTNDDQFAFETTTPMADFIVNFDYGLYEDLDIMDEA